MTRKLFLGLTTGIAAIAVAAIVTVSSVNARSTESDLLTKNIEALTQYEGGAYSAYKFQGTVYVSDGNGGTTSFLYTECGGYGNIVCP